MEWSFRTLVAACALLFLACHRFSPHEEKLIGTWEKAPIGFGPRCVFNRDHTSAVLFPRSDGKWEVMSKGTWRLEGNDIIDDFKFTYRAPDLGERLQAFKGRTKLLEFQQDRFVVEESDRKETFFRVK
jgi:hypothetical protein